MMNETLTLTLPADAVETLMRVLAESIEERDARIRVLERMRDSGPAKDDSAQGTPLHSACTYLRSISDDLSKIPFPDPFK